MFEDFEQDVLFMLDQLLENWGWVVIFIDGFNFFYVVLQLGIEIDYIKLLYCLMGGFCLLWVFFYIGVDCSNEK